MPKAARKSSKPSVRSKLQAAVVCNATPEPGPFTFPAGGGEFFVLVSYPTGPDACSYTAKSTVRWMTATPRISEFDVKLAPNRRKAAREGVVIVQGQGNATKHKVTIRQSGR